MNNKQLKFWRREFVILDELYRKRLADWQRQLDALDLKFDKKMRNMAPKDIVRVPLFYPFIRQTIGTIAFNYPTIFFNVEDEVQGVVEGVNVEIKELLERAAASFLRLTDARAHVHQGIFDAMTCAIGWIRLDVNPPGDDMIAPFVTNDSMHEDLVNLSRVAPGFVHVDPLCSPHQLGHARYIREKMWMPLKFLVDSKEIKNKTELKATTTEAKEDIGFGEPMNEPAESAEQKAIQDAIQNDDYVLVDRVHDRINKKLIMFAKDVEFPIMEIPHPFLKMSFAEKLDRMGQPMRNLDTGEPILDLENGEVVPGWLCENGFPFIPVKFDMHATSFYPKSHLEMLEDSHNALIESISREVTLLKRTSRQLLVNKAESKENTEVQSMIASGEDGQSTTVQDHNNYKVLDWGSLPPEHYSVRHTLEGYFRQIAQTDELTQDGASPRTATENAIRASTASINREWMESKVSEVYERCIRDPFQIMGDPRYTPESFAVNVAPEGSSKIIRMMESADFLWNYRIEVKAGSMQPLIEQIETEIILNVYPLLKASPNFDQVEVDKMLLAAIKAVDDIDRLMADDNNVPEQRAAQMENRLTIMGEAVDVLPQQDAKAHIPIHQQYQQDPKYQQLMMAEQNGDRNASARKQQIDQAMQQHLQQHSQVAAQQQEQISSPGGSRGTPSVSSAADTLQGQVQSNAAKIENRITSDTVQSAAGGNGSFLG
jgi:hypothetical protein